MLLDRELDMERIVSRVGARTGLAEREQIERAVEATLEVLAEYELERDFDAPTFYHRISEREGTGLGVAMEHAQVVMQTVAEMIGEEERRRLVRHLPVEMERLLQPEVRSPAEPRRGHVGKGHTLATGHPGSGHPVSEAHPERAHAHSVARSDAPHGDTQLSTTHGVKKSRTLAEDEPGSDRPLIDERE